MSPNQRLFGAETEARVLNEFRRAAAEVPAYRILLEEQASAPATYTISRRSPACARCCPRTTPSIASRSISSASADADDVADVLTSSGHGGRFSFGVISRKQACDERGVHGSGLRRRVRRQGAQDADDQLSADGRGVLVACMTVATTSVREDMAVALVEAFGHHYEQIVLSGIRCS